MHAVCRPQSLKRRPSMTSVRDTERSRDRKLTGYIRTVNERRTIFAIPLILFATFDVLILFQFLVQCSRPFGRVTATRVDWVIFRFCGLRAMYGERGQIKIRTKDQVQKISRLFALFDIIRRYVITVYYI